MGFKASNLQVKEDSRKYSKPQTEDLLLNKDDLEFLLGLVKNSTFKGEQIEMIYNLTSSFGISMIQTVAALSKQMN